MDINKIKIYEDYFQSQYKHIVDYIYKRVLNHHEAEDLAMDSFLSAYKKLDSFDPAKASMGTWIYVIVNNKLKNYYRDKKIEDDIENYSLPTESFEDEVLAAEYLSNMRHSLANGLDLLSEQSKSIVIMRYFKNMTSGEIALKLGLTSTNVRVILNRSLAKLKKYFDEHDINWEL